jgi:hypothetical protein
MRGAPREDVVMVGWPQPWVGEVGWPLSPAEFDQCAPIRGKKFGTDFCAS